MTAQIHWINHDNTYLKWKCGSIADCILEITRRFNNLGAIIGFPILVRMVLHVGFV